jgi:hypothetical protein
MRASPLLIYLGCAGLIVGSLGLGAHHMLGGNSVSATSAPPEQPLFARSVNEAALPSSQWPSQTLPSQTLDVAFYGPTLELLTQAAASSEPRPVAAPSDVQEQQTAAAPREAVRDLPRQQARQPSKRVKNARVRDEVTTSTEPDPRDARAQERQRVTVHADEEREAMPRRSERRYRESGQRVVIIREDAREPEPGPIRAPEPRENVGFSPLRIFGGIFEPR